MVKSASPLDAARNQAVCFEESPEKLFAPSVPRAPFRGHDLYPRHPSPKSKKGKEKVKKR
jgi:hypothetical protein